MGFAPFWNARLTESYEKCAFPIETDSADLDSNSSNGCSNDSAFDSWFSIQRTPLPSKSSPKTSWRSCMSFPADSTVSVDTLKPPKKRSRTPKLKTSSAKTRRVENRTRKIRMRLTKDQKKTICDWMGAARFTYNKSLEAVKKGKFPFDQNVLRDRFVTAKERSLPRPLTKIQSRRENRLRENDVNVGRFLEEHPWLKNTPKCIRYNALISLVKAHDSNTAKREAMKDRGEKKHTFKLNYRSRKHPSSWTIEIDATDVRSVNTIPRPVTRHKNDAKHANRRQWTEVSIFEKMLGGKLLLTEKIPGEAIVAGIKITRNRLGHFHAHVPITTNWDDLPNLKPESERKVVALDPGVRTFQTFYSPDEDFGGYAAGERGFSRVFLEAKKCDEKIAELTNTRLSYLERTKLIKAKHRCIERTRNLVNEVHKKVANDLCDNYDTIVLPAFQSQKMVKKKPNASGEKRRTIRSKTARALLAWKHFEFRSYLASKVLMRGKELAVVTEEYTTQCCGRCGVLNKNVGSAKIFECGSCGLKCGRDENAARNIFLKYLIE